MLKHKKPTHVYIGREQCGCCTALVDDGADDSTAELVADIIKSGRTITRVTWKVYVSEVSKEPTFMKCSHGEQPINQLELF